MRHDDPAKQNSSEKPTSSLRTRVFSGVAWSLLQTTGSRVLSMVIILILARLLGPEAFGIVTIVFVILGALTTFVDLGVSDILVRRVPQHQADYDSAFWVALSFSVVLAAAAAAMAGNLAIALNQPFLPPLLWIAALTLPLSAIEIILSARMRAEMQFKRLALRSLAATLVGGTVGIAMALGGASYWSLLAKGLAEAATSVVLLWASSSYRPRFQFSWQRWRELFESARHLLGGRMLDIVNQRYDAFVVSARLGPNELGLYAAGQRLYSALLETLFTTVNRVTLPAFAKMGGDHARMQRSLLRLIRVTSFFTFPMFAAMGLLAELLVVTLLGEPWSRAASVLSALCIGGLLFSVSYYNASLFTAAGRTELLFRLMLANAASIVLAVSVGSLWGVVGVALGFALRGYVLLPLNLTYLRRAIGLQPSTWLTTLAPAALATALSSAILATAQLLLAGVGTPLRLLVLMALFPVVYALVVIAIAPGLFATVLEELSTLHPVLARLSTILRRWELFVTSK